ncbi:YwqG family protein [uncultured Roseovarius sp.]|uniref:YwqG family protein n=1 Tax=uncultured Roseovarius sp. TaxID=293344 RepID=UPI0026118FC3|nr:YwqG family protein [uncultured Roseovarius sp.]
MTTFTGYARILGLMLLGAAVAQLAISSDTPPYLTLIFGIGLLLFSQSATKYLLLGLVNASTWYHGKRLPGYRKLPNILNWIRFELTATRADRKSKAKAKRRTREIKAEQKRQAELRERYKDVTYTTDEVAAFFLQHSVQVAYLALDASSSPRSRSRFGDVPRTYPGFEWPRSDKTGLPLHFLVELHLSEIPPLEETAALPVNGVLLFFSDLSNSNWVTPRVLFTERVEERAQVPDDLPEVGEYIGQYVKRTGASTLRLMPEFALRPVTRDILQPPSSMPADVDWKLVNAAQKHSEKVYEKHVSDTPELQLSSKYFNNHTIGGPASEVPNPTGGKGFKLLQLDSDTKLGLMIGDCGVVEFWIDPDDLAAGRFEKVWLASASA